MWDDLGSEPPGERGHELGPQLFVGLEGEADRRVDPAGLLVEVPAVRQSFPVDSALRVLRANRRPMGFVTDSRGRTVGIVTVKDLVEEVSGELPVF